MALADRKIPVSISLDALQVEELDAIAAKTRISRSVLVREGIQIVIEHYRKLLKTPFPRAKSTPKRKRR